MADPGDGAGGTCPQSPKFAAFIVRPNSQIKNAFCFRGPSSPGPQPRGTFGLGSERKYPIAYCYYKVEKTRHFCRFHWTLESSKAFSFRGASPPDPPTRRSAPGPRWGLCPQTPVIGSRSTRSPCPPIKFLHPPLPWTPSGTSVPQTPSCFVICGVQKILKICSALLHQNLGIISYGNRVIANMVVWGPQCGV